MKTCEECLFWLNRQMELECLEGVGFCNATKFDDQSESNIIVSHNKRRKAFGDDLRLITYRNYGCVNFKTRVPLVEHPHSPAL